MNRSTCRWIAQVAVLLAFAAVAVAQNPNCGIDQGNAQTSLPNFAGTLPSSPEMALGDGDSHLYVLTQWGVARAPRNPSNPSPYSQIVIGNEGGSGNGGVIQILCDCHQGSNTMDAAQGPNGEARVIVDWQPYAQGGPPGSDEFSGLPGMVAMASSTGSLTFGQQINLPGSVAPGADVAAIYTGSKYFGYFPLKGDDVWLADITSPTGQPGASNAIQPQNAIGWPSGILSGASVRLAAQHVTVGGYDKYLLVGGSMNDDTIHVAEINPTTGIPNEVASVGAVGQPTQIEIAQVNGHIYILSSEGAGGLQVYEYTPPASLQHIATLAGTVKEVEVRGPQPFPALFLYRDGSGGNSYVDIYDTKWLGGSGTPLLAKELQHYGSGISFKGLGFEAEVVQSGAVLTAYVHRKLNPPPPGLPGAQSPIRTDKIDISCIAADPTAPPVALATMINLSAQARSAPENTKNYFGDKWELIDSSVTYQPLTNVQWDIDTGASGPFAADPQWSGNPAQNPELEDINPAYWPCNPSGGGNLALGTACFGSVGGPVGGGTFYLGLKTTNQNGASAAYFSPGVQVLAPTVSIVGFDGSVLHVLAGNPNNGDASASTGNTGEATFSWTFTPSGNASGTVVTIPPSATGFSLLATYKDGFSVTKTGSIQQVDLVPNFSLTPTTVLKGGTMTSKNLMQKAAAATLNSVDYAFTPSGGSGTLVTCPGGFCNVNGTAPVTAPDTIGNYTLTLTYKYTDHNGAAKTGTASQPFTVTDWVPSPALGVYRGTNHTQPVPALGNPPSFGLTAGTTYYLWDDQILPNGVPHPGASFYKSSDSNPSISGGDTPIGSSAGAGPVTYAPTSCTSNCYFKVQVSGVVNAFKYTATGSGPPPPPPPPPGSVAVNGPASGSPNVSYTYTAVTNGLNNITAYEWDFGDGSGGGSPPPPPPPGPCPPVQPNCGMGLSPKAAEAFSPGSQQQPHTFAAAGNFGVKVRVTAGGTTYTSPAFTVQIGTGGPPPPLNTFDVVGGAFNSFNNTWNVAAGNVITFTAGEPDPAATFAWDFGDGDTASGNVVTHVFRRADRFTVTLTVSGGGTSTSGISEGNATFIVSPPSFQAIMVPGAGSILADSGDWATDVTITNPGGGQQGSTKVTLYFASFADEIPTDLSTLPFDTLKSVPLGPGESWSAVDVVGTTLERPGAGKGILLVKFEGGNQLPIVTARVYFTAQGASFGTALPSFLVGPFGPLTAQAAEVATGQFLIGLRDDSLYRFNISLFNASSEGGLFHVDAFSEDGVAAGSKDFAVPAYSQAGVNATDVIPNLDATKRYVLKATSTAGSLQAYSSQLDRRNNDPVQVSDDTPRVNAAPDTTVTYYVAGVGRIEENGAHWRTDLRFYNPSSFQRTVALEYHYVPASTTTEQVLFSGGTMGAGQGVSVDDVVAQLFAPGHPDRPELMSGTVIGLLKVTYSAPPDIASAPLIIGGRIYQDFPQGTAGMQLSVYASDKSVSVSNGRLYMAGAQTNLRFRTNVGIFAMGDLPTTVRITAVKQDGTLGGQYDYRLNDPGKSGAFAQIPVTEDTFPDIDGDPMAMKVETLDGSPVGSYIVTLDNISSDTVFVQGTPVR